MAKRAVVVRYRVKPGKVNELLALLKAHIARTKDSEPGCVQFDVLVSDREPDTVHLYEVYADDAVFDIHNASPNLLAYKQASEPLLLERDISWCTVLE